MNAQQSPSFDNHEHVAFIDDQASGLKAIIAVHNTHLGPAVGGCRMFPYANEAQALSDVLRLSRGMTYKSALAGLPMGGGKAVIIGDPSRDKTPKLLAKMGEFIDSLNGLYVSAEDSGTSVQDLKTMSEHTSHVLGINESQQYGGDPSPLTAHGIFCGIRSAVVFRFNDSNLNGLKVSVQGAGAVGRYLIKELIDAGASVTACDINHNNLAAVEELGAKICPVDDIMTVKTDVFAPCAMGAILNDSSIDTLAAGIVAGGANNQLALAHHGQQLHEKGVLYAPDYVINAGGIIEICRQLHDDPLAQTMQKIEGIGDTLTSIFYQSSERNLPTALVADGIAESLFSVLNSKSINTQVA